MVHMTPAPDRYCKLFLQVVRDNPGCTRKALIEAGIPPGHCNLMIGRYEFERIRVKRDRSRVLQIWLKEDFPGGAVDG